ncbi:MAG: ATP synthase F1 subunit delta [Candidatus Azobacteroides pseudotrichonymphae]|jgi:F-type H+-transporting ATPase subunit delta|nr:MAG: ATP synthase F1 subunit delta [Candidatus Azobacteroides pseudotrichonymphae]
MEAGKISTRYARAIYEYALEQGNETILYKGMQSLAKHFAMYPVLKKSINDPTLSDENKIKLLIAACRIDSNKTLKQAIKVIVKNGRAYYIERIARMYEKEYRQSKGLVLAQLTTVGFTTNNEAKKLLIKFLSNKTNGQIEFKTILNLDIIGGFILEIEDLLLDASVKRQLNQIKCQI